MPSAKYYRATNFEYKVLDKIHGTPDIGSLVKVFRQLKRKSQSIPTTLGGGHLGYLALVLLPAAYTSIPNAAAFSRPTRPGVFTVTALINLCSGTNAISSEYITQQKTRHDEFMHVYNECQAMEQAL